VRLISWFAPADCEVHYDLSAASGHLAEDHTHRGERHDQDGLRADDGGCVAALSRVSPGEAHFGLGRGTGASVWRLMTKEARELANGWLHPRGGCGYGPSLQDTLKARVAADFERR
jgi:hypothetical protein